MSDILKAIKSVLAQIANRREISGYDDFSIAEYFRKQGAKIGEFNRIQVRTLAGEPYLISIGNHCTICQGVTLLTHDGGCWIFTDEFPDLQKYGPIKILDNCFIGINSTILPGITIGPNSVVGADSVVTKDVPPRTVVAGNPARIISSIEKYRAKVLLTWESQRPSGYFHLDPGSSPVQIEELKRQNSHLLKAHLIRLWGI